MKNLTLLLIIIALIGTITMSSKSRGGLSKRELASKVASQKKKTVTKKASSSSSLKPKYILDTSGGLPVYRTVGQTEEQARVEQKKNYDADVAKHPEEYKKADKKKAKNQEKRNKIEEAYKRLDQRTKASSVATTNSTDESGGGIGDILRKSVGINTAEASDGTNRPKPTTTSKQTGFGRAVQIAMDPLGVKKKVWGDDRPQFDLGVTEALGVNDLLRKETPTGLAEGSSPIQNPKDPNFNFLEASKSLGGNFQDVTQDTTPTAPSLPVEQDYTPQNTGNSGYSSGYTAAPEAPAQDDYTSSLQDYVKGFGKQEKSVDKMYDNSIDSVKEQIKALIAALDPEYAAYQAQSQQELEKSKTGDVNQLASLFAAYGTADSEQRMQQQERVQSDYASKLADLLTKLQLQKQKDITGYQTKGMEATSDLETSRANAINQILASKNDAKLNVAQMLNQARQAGVKSGGRSSSSARTAKASKQEVSDWVQDALSKGYSWQEIADSANSQGIDTYTGSYLDQLLNKAF